MKTGRTLLDLAQEIERQQNAKRDFVTSTANLVLDDELQLGFGDQKLAVNHLAHNQLAEHTKIPTRYYDRMREAAPQLLAANVNNWLHKEPAPRLIRTLDGTARAFLSDRYRPLENADLAEAVLPTLLENNLQIVSCEITDKKLYIKVVDPRIQRDIPKGSYMGDGGHTIFDTVCPAMTISNSEVGYGSLSVEVGTLTKACTNLMFFSQSGLKKYHIGGKHELGEDLYRLLSDETRQATDKAVWLQVRDTVKNAFDEAKFGKLVETITDATKDAINDPLKIVEVTAKKFGFNDGQKTSILQHLIRGADTSRYGLMNAVTRTAEDQADYEVASLFEKAGGQIIELNRNEWKAMNEAA